MWKFNKTKEVVSKGIFDETSIPKNHTTLPKKTKEQLDLESAIKDIKDVLKPKYITGESLPDSKKNILKSSLKRIRKMLGKQSKVEIFEDKLHALEKLMKHCKSNGWNKRKDWTNNNIEMEKAYHEFLSASIMLTEYLYDQNTALPLNPGVNKFEKPRQII
jgi:hypothetical protein